VKPVPVSVNLVFALPAGTTVGEIEESAGGGFTMVTDADAAFVASARLVAVTVTVLGDGSIVGAVYSPVLLIVPKAELSPTDPFTDHETPALLPVTVAENWICSRRSTWTV
jgi:hypothetical protein